MTQADSVLSTPPTNTSVHNPSRRGFLAQAVAAAAGGAALGATLPLPVSAQSPRQVGDPIYAIIERHRKLSDRYDAAVGISASLEAGPDFEAADEISGAACTDLINHADILVRSEPTTLAGVVALLRYVATLEEWEAPRDFTPFEVDGEPGWVKTLCTTVANALDRIGGGVA
jgi:hypothetical protein